MPSPLGHALAGAAAGWAVAGPGAGPSQQRQLWRRGAAFALLGMLPDVDLLIGGHRGPSHSLTAALLVGVAVLVVSREKRLALAAAVAYASHVLLDWLGSDTSPPIGIMALWPFTHAYYQSQAHLFDSVSRRYWLPGFWTHNFRAVGWELVVLLPIVFVSRLAAGKRR
jgi:membrane-bound metal-dependent hydrolase YbcI (DUF457 family)